MISLHLPALQVVVPLMTAALCILLRRATFSATLAALASWVSLGIAVALYIQVAEEGPFSYLMGGWEAPWGIEYRVDRLSAFVLVLVSGIGSITSLFAPSSVAREISEDRIYIFNAMYLLTLAGLLGMTITGDAFNLFVFLEISSLSSYVLISLGRDRRALTAALCYLVLGTIGATFYVIGVGMLYQMTGTLNMADLAERLPAVAHTRTVLAAVGFLTVGIGLKLGLFPLHFWLPAAYTRAPSVVTAFLAATATKVSIYVLLRIYYTFFQASIFENLPVQWFLFALALAAIISMSAGAIFQEDAKRLLAYSSVAQIGYMILGVSLVTATGLSAGILHMFNHALMKSTLFLALGCVFFRIGSVRIADMAGLGRAMPLTMAAFVIGALSLIGVPLTAGFISKWFLIQAALDQGWWAVAVIVPAASLLAMAYLWKIVEIAYFQPRPAGTDAVQDAPAHMLVPVWILAGANIYFGISTEFSLGSAKAAALFLMGSAP